MLEVLSGTAQNQIKAPAGGIEKHCRPQIFPQITFEKQYQTYNQRKQGL